MIPLLAVPWVQVLNCTALFYSKRSQTGAHLSTGTREHLKEQIGTLGDQKVAEIEEKLPDQIQSLKKVNECFLCLRTKMKVQQQFSHPTTVLAAMGLRL